MAQSVYQKTVSFTDKLKALHRVTRWRQHVPYTIPLVLMGGLLAVYQNQLVIDWRILPVVIANVLAMIFAFMINDIQDAPDDQLDPRKSQRNVFSQGIITSLEGVGLSVILVVSALILFWMGGWFTFIIGSTTLFLCYLYSAKPFRLKARPVVDVLSHILMLSGLLILSGYYTYDTQPGLAWLVILAVTLVSAYGQFYNQVDDFDVDKQVGLKNTAILIGKNRTVILMYISITTAIILFAIAIGLAVFPSWLGLPALATAFTLSLFKWDTDMREHEADLSGALQKPILITFNMIAFLWLLGSLGLLG